MITNERRAFKRVNRRFTVAFKPHSSQEPYTATSLTKNISAGGVYFTSLKAFGIGELLDCNIKLPNASEEGKWLGRVVRCENIEQHVVKMYGVAVEFVKSFGSSDKNLRKLLEEKNI